MAKGGGVVPLRLTAAVATRRIHAVASGSGAIGLGAGLREKMAEIEFSHPALALFLVTARVVGDPQPVEPLPGGWRCRLEGLVKSVNTAAWATVVLLDNKVLVEEVEWA